VIHHILHYETLNDEFPKLMARYGLQRINLLRNKIQGNFNAFFIEKKLGVKNLTQSNVELINKVYHQDFDEFGYSKYSFIIK